ncbi:MAG: type II toxin-antitoxin system RelE family toxin [Anaerolineae bacterium]
MSRRIIWTEPARASLRKLDRQVAREVAKAVSRLADTGAGDLAHLRPPETGYRLRVRNWRVFLDMDKAAGTITVHRIEHRSRAYKRR